MNLLPEMQRRIAELEERQRESTAVVQALQEDLRTLREQLGVERLNEVGGDRPEPRSYNPVCGDGAIGKNTIVRR